MSGPVTNFGAKAERIDAVQDQAQAICDKGTASINVVLNGGKSTSRPDSETVHRISAAIARDVDAGRPIRPTHEYVREARRR